MRSTVYDIVTPRSTIERICSVITDKMNWPHAQEINASRLLGESGLALDSVMIIEMAVYLEGEFGVRIPDDMIAAFASMDIEGVASCIDSLHPCVAPRP